MKMIPYRSRGLAAGKVVVLIVLAVGVAMATVSVMWWTMQADARKQAPVPRSQQATSPANDTTTNP